MKAFRQRHQQQSTRPASAQHARLRLPVPQRRKALLPPLPAASRIQSPQDRVQGLQQQLSKYDKAMLQKTNEGLRAPSHERMPQHHGARTGWLSDFIVLPQVLKACVEEGFPLSDSQLQALFTDVQPPPDGKFFGVFIEMLEALETMRPGMSPPLSWLLALDDALLARSNATSFGDCATDYQNGLQRIRELTMSVNPRELMMVLRQFVRAQVSSPHEILKDRVFIFPLAAEAYIKECGSPPEYAEALQEIDAFHNAVFGQHSTQGSQSESQPSAQARGCAYARSALRYGGGSGGGRGTSTTLHWQLQVPLLRRYSACFEYQDMLALAHASLSSIEDRCTISVNMVDSKIAGTCQACLVKVTSLARQRLASDITQSGSTRASAQAQSAQPSTSNHQSSPEGATHKGSQQSDASSSAPAQSAAQVLQLGAELVAWMARTTLRHGIQPYQLYPPVVEGAVGCMRDAAVVLAGSKTSPGQRDGLGAAPARTLDEVCHVMDSPSVLVDALVVLAHCPQAHYRTPYQAAAMLRRHLGLFSDPQIIDMLQALGKLKVSLKAGQGSREDAAGFDLLTNSGVSGDPAQQGLLTWEGRVPEDVAQRYPQVGPACDEDPSLDLLTRIGLRLSRSLNSQTPEQQATTLQQLGVFN